MKSARLAMSLLRLVQPLVEPEAELNRLVAVLLVRPDLRDHIRAAFDDGHRVNDTRLIEDLRHPQLSARPFPESLALPCLLRTRRQPLAAAAFRA